MFFYVKTGINMFSCREEILMASFCESRLVPLFWMIDARTVGILYQNLVICVDLCLLKKCEFLRVSDIKCIFISVMYNCIKIH